MVFIGPKSREDRGFEHSYDVLVDSYESEEDISDWNNYKMAGRVRICLLFSTLSTIFSLVLDGTSHALHSTHHAAVLDKLLQGLFMGTIRYSTQHTALAAL